MADKIKEITKDDVIVIDGENSYSKNFINSLLKYPHNKIIMVVGEHQNVRIPYNGDISILRCEYTGKNVADFLIMAAMSREIMVNTNENTRFIIVSSDHGFDAAIKYINVIGTKLLRAEVSELEEIMGLAVNKEVENLETRNLKSSNKVTQEKSSDTIECARRHVELAKLLKVSVEEVLEYPKCFFSVCGYITKHFKSGQNANYVKGILKELYSRGVDKTLEILEDKGIVRKPGKRNQFYFTSEKLKQIASLSSKEYGGNVVWHKKEST